MEMLSEVVVCRFHGAESCACPETDRERFVREGALMEVGLRSLSADAAGIDATLIPHPEVVRVLYAGLVKLVGDAPNYVETKVRSQDGLFVVTARRADGKTPHELRREAEERADEWKRIAVNATDAVDKWIQTYNEEKARIFGKGEGA